MASSDGGADQRPNAPGVWFPTIRAHSGTDVFTERLCTALNARGIRAEIHGLPLRAEYAPWLILVPRPPGGATVAHVNSWLPRRFLALGVDEARAILDAGRPLSALEDNGLLHALQILIENAIRKAKQWLKSTGRVVPISAYDTFAALASAGMIDEADLKTWNALVGIRNRIVHDDMNMEMPRIYGIVQRGEHQFVVDFLMKRP